MEREPNSVRELIGLWSTRKEFREDLQSCGFDLTIDRVHKWAQSGAIPAKYHQAVISSAEARHIPITADQLISIHHCPDRQFARSATNSTSNQETSHDKPHAKTASDAA